MAAKIRLGGALALMSAEAEAHAAKISELEEERNALEVSLNEALARAAASSAEAHRVSSQLSSVQHERDAAVAAADAAKTELAEAKRTTAAQQAQHELLVERLQQLLRDLAIADERGRESAAEVARLSKVAQEQQGEIRALFAECASQRARADAATESLGAALAEERERSAALASSKARREVRGGEGGA